MVLKYCEFMVLCSNFGWLGSWITDVVMRFRELLMEDLDVTLEERVVASLFLKLASSEKFNEDLVTERGARFSEVVLETLLIFAILV